MKPEIKAGDLRQKVVFKKPLFTKNTEGGQEKTYPGTGDITTMACIRPVRSYRMTQGLTSALIEDKDFFVRFSNDRELIDKDWLMNYDGQDYTIGQIEHMNELEKWIRFTGKVRSHG